MQIREEFESFVAALRFFTRLKLPGTTGHGSVALERAIRYFPAAGLIIGCIAAFVFAVTTFFWPKSLAVLAAIAVAIYLTGALHEDGWSDMVDGFGGGQDGDMCIALFRD